MSAFASLIAFVIIAIGSMCVVAFANYKVEQAKKVRHRLHKYKARVEELEDVVLALDQLCENRAIPKMINDEVIEIYSAMIDLDDSAAYLKAGHSNALMRSDELSDETAARHISRLCNSDAQIARIQAYLNEACNIVKKQHNQGKMSTTQMQDSILDLEWLYLQVYVISNIVQGHKAYNKQDILTANAFYKKAQTELMRSGHPDERRHKMMKQLADILFGRRKSLDTELMPEDEFNPDDSIPMLSPEDQKALEELMQNGDLNPEDAQAVTEAMLNKQQNQASSQPSNNQ
ncbi:MAG: hypothetical protein ACRBCI_01930 [Cellvibrionaceae bacterium]